MAADTTTTVSLSTPVANLIAVPTTGQAPLAVTFSDLSTGNITSWAWVFGDGGTSNQPNPTHIYIGPGNHTVSLTVSGPGGSSTKTSSGYIRVLPNYVLLPLLLRP